MARNSEKAASMLFRFREAQAAEHGVVDIGRTRRPTQPNTIDDIPTCERWRGQVIKDISFKVTRIQDDSLADHVVRDLNDEINRLMHEKYRWERRIRALGGPDYTRATGGIVAADGRQLAPGSQRGYRYFGRAKELPGVKELFAAAAKEAASQSDRSAQQQQQRARADLRRAADAAYYGYTADYDDHALLAYETDRENQRRSILEAKARTDPPEDDSGWEELPGDIGDGNTWSLPTLEQVQAELVERKKRKLLESLGAS